MEEIVSFFENNSDIKYVVDTPRSKERYFPFIDKKEPAYRVYSIKAEISPQAARIADSTHQWWMYPLGYDEQLGEIFDKYETKSLTDKSLEFIAQMIKKISIALSFFSIIFVFYMLLKEEQKLREIPIEKIPEDFSKKTILTSE